MLSNSQCSPLVFAAYSGNLACIKLLLEAGASVADKDHECYGPLHYACMMSHQEEVYSTLLIAGSGVNSENSYGNTPLNIAAQWSSMNVLRLLIISGAKIDTVDCEGDSSLMNALYARKNETVRFLLQVGIDYTVSNMHGNTFLHYAALYGDLQTIEILRAAQLSKADPWARNNRSKTSTQLIGEGATKPEGFADLFQVMIWEISNRRDYLVGVDRRYHVPGAFEPDDIAENQLEEDGNTNEAEEFFDATG